MDKSEIETQGQRIQEYYKIKEQTWSSVEELGFGLYVYRDVIPQSFEVAKRLEEVILNPNTGYSYQEALVGYQTKMPEYRDCYDFKFKKSDLERDTSEESLKLQSLWQDVYDRQINALKDYSRRLNIGELRYWEAMNFIKYEKNQHFMEHHDHGYSYNCVVSMVAYPNDDYEGGELYFRLLNLKIKPRAGDLYIFPSNFMYPHQAMPVTEGTKYSIVTMTDYSDKYHKPELPEFSRETGN
jgi:hypothetical protein